MKKILVVLFVLVGNIHGSEDPGIKSVKWNPDGQFLAVGSSVDFIKQLGPNSFVRAMCDKRTGGDKTDQAKSCESCTAVLEYILAQKSKRAQKQDECLHAVYKLGLQVGRSDKEIEAEQQRVLNSRPALTILKTSEDGAVEEI